MRELLFRAWDKKKKIIDTFTLQDVFDSPFSGDVNLDDFDITQYTELTDKNGVKIFEGDILGGIYEHFYVAFCDNCKSFNLFHCDDSCSQCDGHILWNDFIFDEINNIEVIGNIYENPELLGKK